MAEQDYSAVIDRLSQEIGRVNSNSEGRDRELSSQIDRLDRQNTILTTRVNALEKEVRRLETNLAELMLQVKSSFAELSRKSDELRRATEESAHLVQGEVRTQGGQTAAALQKVYSGAALTDVLAVQGEASKNEITIRRAVDERGTRLAQARKALEEKQEVFDKQFRLLTEGFHSQLSIIAQHIVELQDRLNSQLAELTQEDDLEALAAAEARAGHRAAENWRREALEAELRQLDFTPLDQLKTLRTNLLSFFGDSSLAWIEGESTEPEIDVLTLPFVAVREVTPAGASIRLFSGDMSTDSAYAAPSSSNTTIGMRDRLRSATRGWETTGGSPLPQETLHELLSQIGVLTRAGSLSQEDADAIREHLRAHPLTLLS